MGMERACAVLEDGRLSCWGGAWKSFAPEVVPGVSDAVDVAVVGHTQEAFVARKDGSVLRVPARGPAATVPALRDVVEVTAGVNLVAARTRDGSVSVAESMPGHAKLTWRKLPVKGAKQVSAGGHVCALDAKEQVACFLVDEKKITPYSIPALGAVKRIASGGAATCAVLADGRSRCFEVGQGSRFKPIDLPAGELVGLANRDLDDGPTACLDTPEGLSCKWLNLGADGGMPYLGDRLVKSAAKPRTAQWVSNGAQACRRDTEGRVSCWGTVQHGLLGEPDTGFVTWPAKVPGVEGAVSLATGGLYTCASTDEGKVMCWGESPDDAGVPVDPRVRFVPGLTGVVKVVRVDLTELCAVKGDGSVACFTGRTEPSFWPLVDAPQLRGFREIHDVNGKSALVVLGAAGEVLEAHPFGFADSRITAVKLAPLAGMPVATRVLEEEGLIIAITEKEQAWTVRIEMEGVVGKPVREPKLDGAKEVVGTWAVLWNDGKVSFGDPRKGRVKREVVEPPVVHLLHGRGPDNQLCGVTAEGTVMCRGEERWARFVGLPKVVAEDSFWGQSCVIDTCGGVHCWGTNWAGQAGQSGVSSRPEPRPLAL